MGEARHFTPQDTAAPAGKTTSDPSVRLSEASQFSAALGAGETLSTTAFLRNDPAPHGAASKQGSPPASPPKPCSVSGLSLSAVLDSAPLMVTIIGRASEAHAVVYQNQHSLAYHGDYGVPSPQQLKNLTPTEGQQQHGSEGTGLNLLMDLFSEHFSQDSGQLVQVSSMHAVCNKACRKDAVLVYCFYQYR